MGTGEVADMRIKMEGLCVQCVIRCKFCSCNNKNKRPKYFLFLVLLLLLLFVDNLPFNLSSFFGFRGQTKAT